MKVVFSGGEKGSYRRTLVDNDVAAIALNITQFAVPKTKAVDLSEMFGGAAVYVYTSKDDDDIAKYDEFIRTHHENIECVIGRSDYDGTWLGDKYVPLWNDGNDLERLAFLCERFGRVAIADEAITSKNIKRIKQLHQRWGSVLVGLTSKVDTIESLPWDVVIVTSWTSVVRYGETQVWDGHGLRRYPAAQKIISRKRHRPDITRLGIDFDAVMEDDVKEVAKLAIASWKAWQEHDGRSSSSAYDPFDNSDEEEFVDPESEGVATTPPDSPSSGFDGSVTSALAIKGPDTRHEGERALLPVMGIETVVSVGTTTGFEGDESYDIDPEVNTTIKYSRDGIRNCDSCYLAPRCPGFKEHASCAYDMPIEMKTKEQLRAVLRAILEMQTSRVMFAAFAEELEGQGMDPALSSEMDRLFRLTEQFKNIEDTRDLVRFEMEAKGSSGVISRLFGSEAAAPSHQLDNPASQTQLDSIIEDAEVLDVPSSE